jgi:hypothetical protein
MNHNSFYLIHIRSRDKSQFIFSLTIRIIEDHNLSFYLIHIRSRDKSHSEQNVKDSIKKTKEGVLEFKTDTIFLIGEYDLIIIIIIIKILSLLSYFSVYSN